MSGNLRVEVRMGEAKRMCVDFVPGTPVEPLSVGTAAVWVVEAADVAEVHAYLYFDGSTLFVASVGGAPVSMGGRSVGADWEPVEVPMNIHVGGAKLAVRGPTSRRAGQTAPAAPQPAVVVPVEDDEKTRFKPVPSSVRQGPRGAVLLSAPGVPVARAPSFGVTPDPEATVVVQRPGERALQRPPARPSVPLVDRPPESECTRLAPVEARVPVGSAAPGSVAREVPIMRPFDAVVSTPPHPLASTRQPPTRDAPLVPSGMASPVGGAPPAVMPVPGAAPAPGGMPPGAAGPGALPSGKAPNPALKAWREASRIQRVILVLMPFAFIAILLTLREPPPGAAPSGSAARVATAAPLPSVASSAATVPVPPATPVAPSAPRPASAAPSQALPPAKTAAPSGGKTQERLAADAVAAGDFQVALRRYEALAAAHPDRPVFKEVVKILERKSRDQ